MLAQARRAHLEERQKLLVEWNDSLAGIRGLGSGVRSSESEASLLTPDSWLLNTDDCIHRLFEAQAARTPDAIAVGFEGLELWLPLTTGARVVPWLQDFTLGVTYGPAEVRAQINAARHDGIDEFLLWDPNVTYTSDALTPDAPSFPQ